MMKKMKLLSLLALTLALLMLLVSCGGTGADTLRLRGLLDGGAEVRRTTYGDLDKVEDLAGATLVEEAGDLFYFTVPASTGTKHIVYNAATDKVLMTKTNYYNETFSVTLLSGTDRLAIGEEYFAAYVLGSVYTVSDEPTHATLTLFSADGTEVATRRYEGDEVEKMASARYGAVLDLIVFDEVLYRATENGIDKVTEMTPFLGLPSFDTLDFRSEKYYYALGETEVRVYDLSLAFVSSYRLPEYAEEPFVTVLENGNLLVQYRYLEDPEAEEYELLLDGEKYRLVTAIVTAKNGKAKEITCDYLLGYGRLLLEDSFAFMGIKRGKVSAIANATKTENRRPGEEVLLFIDAKGSLYELEELRGERIMNLQLVASGAWSATTETGVYLIDGKGEILGEVSSATCYADFLECDGKFYGYDLRPIYDYEADGMAFHSEMPSGAVLKKEAEGTEGYDYYLFDGDRTPTRIVSASDSEVSFYSVWDGFYVLRDTGGSATYRYYRPDGTEVLSVGEPLSYLAAGEGYRLYTAENADGETVVYRVEITR